MADNTKTYKEQLGLTRPQEWLEDAAIAAQRFLDEREEMQKIQELCQQYLKTMELPELSLVERQVLTILDKESF